MALIYNVQFKADTNSLQRQIQTIRTELNAAFNLRLEGALTDELDRAVRSSQQLERALRQATTVNGTSFTAMNAELKKMGTSSAEIVANLSSAQMRTSASQFINTFTMADRSALILSGRIQEIGRVLSQSFKFSVAQDFLRFMSTSLESGLRWSKDMNSVLTDISIVTEAVGEDLDKIFGNIVKGANDLKVAAREYAEAALIFYQQGLGEDEVARRSEITIKAAKAAGQATKEMSEQLTAVWNTYKMQGERLENAASIGAKLGAETAVDFKYIAEAMQSAAPAAAQLGVSYESLAAITATVGEVSLQSASTVGNAYKTIFSRFANLKTTGEDQGVTLGRITEQFAEMGIHVLDSAGELKELDEVIMDVGNRWGDYSVKQQQAIAQIAGGTRQFGQFLSLMNNFDKYKTNLQSAMAETGADTLETQFDIWDQSIEASSSRAKEAWAIAFAEMFQQDSIKGFYDTITGIGDVFGGIVKSVGGLPGILTMAAVILQKQILTGAHNLLITGTEIVKNATLTGRLAVAEANSRQQIATAEAKRNAARAAGRLTEAQELSGLLQKLDVAQKYNDTVIRLQQLRAAGTVPQQQEANLQLELLARAQAEHNLAVDDVTLAQRELEIARSTNDIMQRRIQSGEQINQQTQDRIRAELQEADIRREVALERRTATSDTATNALNEANRTLANNVTVPINYGRALAGLSMSAMTASFALTSLSQIMNGTVEPSFGSMIGITTGLTMSIGSLIPVVQNLGMVTNMLGGASAAAQASTGAVAAATAASIGLLVGALALAAGGIWVLVQAYEAMEAKSPEGQLKSAKKALEDLNTTVQKATDEAADLRSVFDGYDAVVTELNNCTKGTDEWFAALKKVNDTVLDILAKNPELAKMDDLFIRNAEGMLEIDEAQREMVLERADFRIKQAQAAQLMATGAVSEKQNIATGEQIASKIGVQRDDGTGLAFNTQIGKILVQSAASMTETTKDFETEVRKVLNQQVAAGTIYQTEVEGLVTQVMDQQQAFIDLGDSIRQTTTQVDTFTQILAQERLPKTGATEQAIAAQRMESDYRTKFNEIKAQIERDMQMSTTTDNAVEILKKYNEATGRDYTADKNLIRGNATKREYAVYDELGQLQKLSKEEIAIQIATAQALDGLATSATEAGITLGELRKNLGEPGKEGPLSKGMERTITGGNFATDITKKEFDVMAGAMGTSEESVSAFLEKQASAMNKTMDHFAIDLGMNSAEEFTNSLVKNLSIKDAWEKALADLSSKQIDLDFSQLSFGGAEGLSKALSGIDLEKYGENAGQSFINGLNTILAETPVDDKIGVVEKLAAIDWSNWSANTGVETLKGMKESFASLETMQKKTTWLDDYNEKIADLNNEMTVMTSVTGLALPQFEKLDDNFLNLSEAIQQSTLAQREIELASAGYDIAQQSLNRTIEEGLATQKEWGDTVDATAFNKAYADEGIAAVQHQITEQENLGNITSDVAETLRTFYSELESGTYTARDAAAALQDAVNAFAAINAEARAAELGITTFEQALEAMNSGLIGIEDLRIIGPDMIQDVEDLDMALEAGIVALPEYAEKLQGVDYTLQDLNTAFAEGKIGLSAYNNLLAEATDVDLDSQEVEKYSKYLQKVSVGADMFADSLEKDSAAAKATAIAIMRMNIGIEELAKGWENWSDVLTKSTEESEEYYLALTDLDSAMSDILNIADGTLSQAFLTNAENMALMAEAAKGSEEAIYALQMAASQDILLRVIADNQLGTISSEIMGMVEELQMMIPDLEVGTRLTGDSEFYQKAMQIVQAAQMSAAQANAFFGSMGFQTNFATKPEAVEKIGHSQITTTEPMGVQTFDTVDDNGNIIGSVSVPAYETFTKPGTAYKYTDYIDVPAMETSEGPDGTPGQPKINSFVYGGSPKTSNFSSMNPGGPPPGGAKKGGGGKGKKEKPKADKKKAKLEKEDPIFERYENINALLKEQADRLKDLAVATDNAYGLSKQKLHAATILNLQKEISLQKQLIEETKKYLAQDREKLAQVTKDKLGIDTKFSNEPGGAVLNQEEIKRKYDELLAQANQEKTDAINKAIEVYNKTKTEETAEDTFKEAEELAKEKYDAFKETLEPVTKMLEQYNKTSNQYVEEVQNAVDKFYKWVSEKIAHATELRDLRIAINETDMRILDLALRRLDKGAENVGKRISKIKDDFRELGESAREMSLAVEDLFKLKDDLNAKEPPDAFKDMFDEEAWAQFKEHGTVPAEVMEKLEDYQSQLLDLQDAYFDKYQEMWDEYIAALEEFSERFDKITGNLDDNLEILTALTEIWEHSGKQYQDTATSIKLLETTASTAADKLESLKAKYDTFAKAAKQAEEDYAWAQSQGYDEITLEGFRKAMEKATEIANDAHVAFVGGVAEYLQEIAELTAKNAEIIYRTWSASLEGLFADIDNAMNMYNQKKKIDDYFLTDTNKLYEIDDIIRAIEKDMKDIREQDVVDTDSLAKYQAMLDKLNARKKDGVGLTQTQADILAKEYDLLKAQYDLKDAQDAKEEAKQAAKNTMRLTRDTSGNWSYLYSADKEEEDKDADKIDDLGKKIADLENDIYNLHRNAADEGSLAWLELQQAYADYLSNIDWKRYEHDLAYKEQVDTTIQWYKEQSALYAASIEEHNAVIGRSFEDTTLGVITGIETMAGAEDWYQAHHIELRQSLMDNYDQWQAKAREVTESVGFGYDNLSEVIDTATQGILDDNQKQMDSLHELQAVADQTIADMQAMVRQMADEWNNQIQKMMAAIDALIAKIQELRKAEAGNNNYEANRDYAQSMEDYLSEEGHDKTDPEYVEMMTQRWWKMHDLELKNLEDERNRWIAMGGSEDTWNKHQEWMEVSGGKMSAGGLTLEEYLKANIPGYLDGGLATGFQYATLSEDGKRELILNNKDTENILQAVQIMRDSISNNLSLLGTKQSATLFNLHQVKDQSSVQPAPVIIQADFPNVSARQEIEAAFNNLINQASQYQLKPRDN